MALAPTRKRYTVRDKQIIDTHENLSIYALSADGASIIVGALNDESLSRDAFDTWGDVDRL